MPPTNGKAALPFVLATDGTLTVLAGGRSYLIARDHLNHKAIIKAVNEGDARAVAALADIPRAVTRGSGGKAEIVDGVVHYAGKPLHTVFTQRLLETMKLGLPTAGWLNFLERLHRNPSKRVLDELPTFLLSKGIALSESGELICLKRVYKVEGRPGVYTDCYTKSLEYAVGREFRVERNTVDDDWGKQCSEGVHVGGLDYVVKFHTTGVVLAVRVPPEDVVSVPTDEAHKMRTCAFTPVEELTDVETATTASPLYTAADPPRPVQAVAVAGAPARAEDDDLDIEDDLEDEDEDDEDDEDDDDEEDEEDDDEEDDDEEDDDEEDDDEEDSPLGLP
jgi:hypothetical protein